jgi:ribonuclease G
MAMLEDGVLTELVIERDDARHIVGNIYKGRVQNVLPGMQAAFVDIGQEKNAFLYIGDGLPKAAVNSLAEKSNFHIGQNVLVQIVKDSVSSKGPRATTHLTLPGRYVVLMPTVDYIGISRRIEKNGERERLKEIAAAICPEGMGLIVRTVAEEESCDTLKADVEYLAGLWRQIATRDKMSAPPTLLYRDADLVIRIVRDYLNEEIDELVIDNSEVYKRAADLIGGQEELLKKIRRYDGSEDLFRFYKIEDEIKNIGKREVELKSGGTLVIDRTEALTVIDVNTGKYVGKTNLSDTVFSTNCEAAEEIARQIRLRDIGGIIIVDFIDMETDGQKKAIMELLAEKVKNDKTKTHVVDITSLGLVELTRKKSRRNFEATLYEACPYCNGSGRLLSPETVAISICRDLRKLARRKRAADGYLVQMNSIVKECMEKLRLADKLCREMACRIELEAKEMHPESYTILQL